MKFRKLLRSPWLPAFLFVAAVICSVLHNLFYAIFRFEEAVFLLLTLAFLLGAVVSLVVVLGRWIARRFQARR